MEIIAVENEEGRKGRWAPLAECFGQMGWISEERREERTEKV